MKHASQVVISNYSLFACLLFALDCQISYSKLKPDKRAEALDLLHAAEKKGFGEQFLKLANDHRVPLAEKGQVANCLW